MGLSTDNDQNRPMEQAMVLNQIQQRLKPKESYFLDLNGESSKPDQTSKPAETPQPAEKTQPAQKKQPAEPIKPVDTGKSQGNAKPAKTSLPAAATEPTVPAPERDAVNKPQKNQSLLRTLAIVTGIVLLSLGSGLVVGRLFSLIAGVLSGAILLVALLLGTSVFGLLGQQKPSEAKVEKIEKAATAKTITLTNPETKPAAVSVQKQKSKEKFKARKTSSLKTKETPDQIAEVAVTAPSSTATPSTEPPSAAKQEQKPGSKEIADQIAAQLASDLEAQPQKLMATYAPEKLTPGNAISRRRRKPGADLKGFKQMADELFKR